MSQVRLSFSSFDRIYQTSVREVLAHWTVDMQTELARHCYPWRPGQFDFQSYLRASAVRFYRAYCTLTDIGEAHRVCDIGGFWGVWPMTLRALGYEVAMTEAVKYYGDSFKALFASIAASGVRIFDYDPFEPETVLTERFDFVTVMAVLEHYPHSLKDFMANVVTLVEPQGRLYLEVPNVAYLPKRIGLLLGRTPQTPVGDIYKSEVPFLGHHHEFTISELRDLAHLSGLSILAEASYNYSLREQPFLKKLLKYVVQYPAFALLKDSRECLAVSCTLNNYEL
jgi:2-polyprenyl-3-methyl-5-hydroxy-6-metoxy-1,4-benzoquinol methylase